MIKTITFAEYETAVNNVKARRGDHYDNDNILAEILGDFIVYGYGLRYCHETKTETGYTFDYDHYDYCD